MRQSLQITSLLIVLCVSGAFSSPSVDRDAETWKSCMKMSCGKPFGGDGMSDDAKYACIVGCCSVARSLNPLVHSEIQQDEEEERKSAGVTEEEFKKNYPKTSIWHDCMIKWKTVNDQKDWFNGVTTCCPKMPPV